VFSRTLLNVAAPFFAATMSGLPTVAPDALAIMESVTFDVSVLMILPLKLSTSTTTAGFMAVPATTLAGGTPNASISGLFTVMPCDVPRLLWPAEADRI